MQAPSGSGLVGGICDESGSLPSSDNSEDDDRASCETGGAAH